MKMSDKSNNWQGWVKMIITVILVPIISVYASFRVLESKVNNVCEDVKEIKRDKVDVVWYEQYIIGQQDLLKYLKENNERVELDSKVRDERLEIQIKELDNYLDKLVREKRLSSRNGKIDT